MLKGFWAGGSTSLWVCGSEGEVYLQLIENEFYKPPGTSPEIVVKHINWLRKSASRRKKYSRDWLKWNYSTIFNNISFSQAALYLPGETWRHILSPEWGERVRQRECSPEWRPVGNGVCAASRTRRLGAGQRAVQGVWRERTPISVQHFMTILAWHGEHSCRRVCVSAFVCVHCLGVPVWGKLQKERVRRRLH